MIQIRREVFETNSSSSHSVSIRKQDDYYTEEEVREELWRSAKYNNGLYRIWSYRLEFGWGFDVYDSFSDKLRYVLAVYLCADNDSKVAKIVYFAESFFEKDKHFNIVLEPWDDPNSLTEYERYSLIDHQSQKMLQDFFIAEDIDYEEFLMNRKYVLWIDDDNNCYVHKLKDAGILHMDDFERHYEVEL